MLQKKLDFHRNHNGAEDKMFIDVNLIKSCKGIDGESAISTINSFMEFCRIEYLKGKKDKVSGLLSGLSEKPYYPCLGFSLKGGNGRGVSKKSLIKVLDILISKEFSKELIEGNIFAPILVQNYDKDRNSDLLIALSIRQFSEYTKKIAIQESLETKIVSARAWNTDNNGWENSDIVLARFSDMDTFHLIVPEDILLSSLPYSARNFLFHYWLPKLNAQREKNGEKAYKQKQFKENVLNKYVSTNEYLIEIITDMSGEDILNYLNRFKKSSIAYRNKK
ncbi:hypothetical protein [Companilactobacillus keshanensis]|uniref:Uncharacterized protein n=1 Tax=Companilactobacillus keshanensis TaxID=2486003 RepID=A0ABW4BSN9_9LACO|nr:hypothetical protein [Companilactobacillus keshanensis]